jgi:hypothetical protein
MPKSAFCSITGFRQRAGLRGAEPSLMLVPFGPVADRDHFSAQILERRAARSGSWRRARNRPTSFRPRIERCFGNVPLQNSR